MTEFSSYATGTPCWVDVTSTDLERSVDFYTGLFGWEAQRDLRPEAGGYTMFTLRGKNVAAASSTWQEGMPAVWTTYLASDYVDATAAKAREAGGNVMMEPFDVFDAGRMALIQDPTGAVFGVWQAGEHHGSQLANEPGSFNWNELSFSTGVLDELAHPPVGSLVREVDKVGECDLHGAQFEIRHGVHKLGSGASGIAPIGAPNAQAHAERLAASATSVSNGCSHPGFQSRPSIRRLEMTLDLEGFGVAGP